MKTLPNYIGGQFILSPSGRTREIKNPANNEVIAQAMRDRATDIHFEPRKEALQIRYRIDGRLVPVPVPKNLVAFQSAIISRIKIMSRLNISEKRRPQDGRITYGGGREEVDVRVSTLPTMYGESVSMRAPPR